MKKTIFQQLITRPRTIPGAEGLEKAEQQSRRLAKLSPNDSLNELRGAKRSKGGLGKNRSLPNLRHDTEAVGWVVVAMA